jgi:predicted nucleotidyltransferase
LSGSRKHIHGNGRAVGVIFALSTTHTGTMTTPSSIHPPYNELRARRLAARRAAAIDALKAADALVRSSGGRLVVFGSLVEGGFHDRSDLDVALCGLKAPTDSRVAVEVELVLADAGFEADVIAERFLPPSLAQRVRAHGCEPSALG